jgi:hypothetical protein
VNPFALQDHQGVLDAIRRRRFHLNGPSPAVRLGVALTELFAMVAIWGSLLYLHAIVRTPPDPRKAVIGTWEALDDSGLRIEFGERDVCVLQWDLGMAVLRYRGRYDFRTGNEVWLCAPISTATSPEDLPGGTCYTFWVSAADNRLRISGPDMPEPRLKVGGHEFPPPPYQPATFKRVR